MRKQYDFSKSKRNPYTPLLKKQITIRLESDTIAYFKKQARETGVSYQTLINWYLRDCVVSKKKLTMHWQGGLH